MLGPITILSWTPLPKCEPSRVVGIVQTLIGGREAFLFAKCGNARRDCKLSTTPTGMHGDPKELAITMDALAAWLRSGIGQSHLPAHPVVESPGRVSVLCPWCGQRHGHTLPPPRDHERFSRERTAPCELGFVGLLKGYTLPDRPFLPFEVADRQRWTLFRDPRGRFVQVVHQGAAAELLRLPYRNLNPYALEHHDPFSWLRLSCEVPDFAPFKADGLGSPDHFHLTELGPAPRPGDS